MDKGVKAFFLYFGFYYSAVFKNKEVKLCVKKTVRGVFIIALSTAIF